MAQPAKKRVTERAIYLESVVTAVGATIELEGLPDDAAHSFVGAQFFSDAAGTTPATPTAGTLTIAIQTFNSQPKYDPISKDTIKAKTPETVSWAANAIAVRATPASIAGAAFYKIVVTSNYT